MKKVIFVLSIMATFGLLISACGGSDGNPCKDLANLMLEGMDEGCSGKDADCCFCKCWNDGHQTYDTDAYMADGTCTCEAPEGNGGDDTCEGADKEAAEACLADDACKDQTKEGGKTTAEQACTGTPLE